MVGIIKNMLAQDANGDEQDVLTGTAASTSNQQAQQQSPGYDPEKIALEDSDTVEGRVKGIIASNSPIMTLAKTGAAQRANSRGLLNTSMALGEAEKAVIETATPIAAQDAQNSLAVKTANQNAQNQANSQKLTGDQNLQQIQAQGDVNSKLNQENYTYEMNLQQLRGDQARQLSELETRANQISQASNSVGLISSQVNAAIGEILANTELTTETKQQLIDLQMQQYRNQLAVIGGMNDLNLTGLLDFSNLGGSGAPVTSGSGNGGPVTGGPNSSANTYQDYVSALLTQGGGQPSESLITASLDEAIRRGEDANSVFGTLSKLYPTVPYDQFVQEVAARGYQVQGGKITKTGATSQPNTQNPPATNSGNSGQGQNSGQNSTTEFLNFTGTTLNGGATEDNIVKVLNKARSLGVAPRTVYDSMSPYFPGISYEQFLNEVAARGYYDLVGGEF